ncbi:MAG: SWIM zinc finger family protein [Candidatus Odinarchaeota archaeon]
MVIKIDNRKKQFMESRRSKGKKPTLPQKKTQYERQRTHEEVEQIKKDLLNYANTSWGKKWIKSNLKIGRPFRMQRGIEYVKDKHRIDNLSISPGQIFATVQGTAPTPYRVKIKFETILEKDWKVILKKLINKPANILELIEGSLPEEIISIFNESEYSLFPDASKGLNATCSCPDKAIPCKHIAAVILYIARVIDFNPFLLLELRGKSKNDILTELSLSQSLKSKKELEKASTNQEYDFQFNIPKITIQELSETNKEIRERDFKINFEIRKPGKIIETVENLGIPQNIENKAFEIVLRAIYKKITSEIYSLSSELGN